MNLLLNNKSTPILKVLLYIVFGLIFSFLSNIPEVALFSSLITLVAAAFFAIATYHIGLFTLIPIFMVCIAMYFVSDIYAVLMFIPTVLLSVSIGFLLRTNYRPSEKIAVSAVIYTLGSIIVYSIIIFMETGGFDVNALLKSFGNTITELINAVSNELREITGISIGNIGALIDFIKTIMIGTYLAICVSAACFTYCLAAIISKSDKNIEFASKPLDIRASVISSVILLICLFSTLFMNIPTSGLKFYSTLTVNLFFTLSPLFFISGLYYILKIKFTVEHGSPVWLIITIIISFVSGIYFLIVYYLIMCGAMYSIKYNKLEKLKGHTNGSKQ